MKTPTTYRMHAARRKPGRRWGPQPPIFGAELRSTPTAQVLVDLPLQVTQVLGLKPGGRLWFQRVGNGISLTARPYGPRQERRWSRRVRETHLPLRLLLRYRRKVPYHRRQ